ALFFIYSGVVGGTYWFFIVWEQTKITKAIEDLDSANTNYYISDNLEQGLFNISDLIQNYYDPLLAIKSIESAYIPGSSVSNFSFDKISKSITIAMSVASNNPTDATKQVTAFKSLPLVNIVNYSAITSVDSAGLSFSIEIILK
ncbi:MAG: hypothetical protein WD512_15890, partial [Candidatus Paceibacterota bacterium]